MGPKAKRRRNKLSIIEEEIFNEKLELLLFKYRKDEVEEDEDGMETETVENDSGKGMFEETGNKIQVTDIKNIANELELDWDETVLVILDEKEKKTGLIEDDRVKIIFQVLKTFSEQSDEILYLFQTFSESETQLITHESLSRSLKHLNIKESAEKVSLLLGFAHEESFLDLILQAQTTDATPASLVNKSGVTFEEFKRTFIRSSYLNDSKK